MEVNKMETINIQSIEEKAIKTGKNAGNKFLSVTTDHGKVSVFDIGLFAQVKEAEGKMCEGEITQVGDYKNLTAIGKILGEAVKPRDDSLLKQASVMISYAKDLAVGGIIKPEQIATYARSFYNLQKELIEEKEVKPEFMGVPVNETQQM